GSARRMRRLLVLATGLSALVRSTQAQTELRRRSTLRSSRERTDRSGAAADRT
ncbi:hypothetical protein M9458_035632, partial [Cirrhinus mrigala]